jgi:hypothetical protein
MIRADHGEAGARSRAKLDATSVIRFTRDAGVYMAQSDGHANGISCSSNGLSR